MTGHPKFFVGRLPYVALVALGLVSCAADDPIPPQDPSLSVNNVKPKGSVGGFVWGADTLQPLEGAKVQVLAGAKIYPATTPAPVDADGGASDAKTPASGTPALTRSDGSFAIGGIEPGSLLVTISTSGAKQYAMATIKGELARAAGDFPVDNATLSIGPIALVPVQTMNVRFVHVDGTLAKDVVAQARADFAWIDFSTGQPVAQGTLIANATSDAGGLASFRGLPEMAKMAALVNKGTAKSVISVYVPAFSRKDGSYFPGMTESVDLFKLRSDTRTIILRAPSEGSNDLKILASTITALGGPTVPAGRRVLPAKGPWEIVFSHKLDSDPNNTTFHIYNETGAVPALAKIEKADYSRNPLVALTFSSLMKGSRYTLEIRAAAKVAGGIVRRRFGAPFFTKADETDATGTPAVDTKDKKIVRVKFSEPVGSGTGSLKNLVFVHVELGTSTIKIGDEKNEAGYATSTVVLEPIEPPSPGPAGLSHFTKNWKFTVPDYNVRPKGSTDAKPDLKGQRITIDGFNATDTSGKPQRFMRADGTLVGALKGVKVQ